MKPGEVRELSAEEKRRKIDDLKQELFNLRFQHGTGQLENPAKMKAVRRDIARLKTILRQDELKLET